jgi:nitrogenase subunit NifH
MEAVSDFIQQIPEETETQLPVCNDVRKAYYILKTILLSSPESVKARIFRDFPASLPTYTGAAIAGADVAVANK